MKVIKQIYAISIANLVIIKNTFFDQVSRGVVKRGIE